MSLRICASVLLLSLCASSVAAQELVALKNEVQRFANPNEDMFDLIDQIVGNLWQEVVLRSSVGAADQQQIGRLLAFSRGDIQTGATSGASGSTSAVLSPLLPAIFGLSFENGAITRTVSGTTITIKANPAGLVCAGKPEAGAAVALRDRAACETLWRRLGVTASFDTSRGEKKTELADLDTLNSQFSELVVRWEVLNRRDVSLYRVRTVAQPFLANAKALADQQQRLDAALENEKGRVDKELNALVVSPQWKSANGEARRRLVDETVRKIVAGATLPPDLAAETRKLWLDTLDGHARVEEAIAGALVITADYSLQRADLATADLAGGIVPKGTRPPNLHIGRVVLAKAPLPNLDVTGNFSIALFEEKRDGMPSHFRDLRAGVEGKFKLRGLNNYGRPTLSFAGLYTYLNQSPLGIAITAPNGVPIAEKGHIGVFQTKLEFPAGNNGVRVPLSLTFSNRTELIKESEVRGQIGVSFNLDHLFAGR